MERRMRWCSLVAHGVAASLFNLALAPGPAPAGVAAERGRQVWQGRARSADDQPTRVRAEDLTDRPARYLGRRVVVTATVRRLLDPVLFTLADAEVLGVDASLPVVLPGRGVLSLPPIAGDQVTVHGAFQRFRQEDFRRLDPRTVERLAWSGLKLEGRPVIIATAAWTAAGLQFYPSPLTRDR